MNGVGADVAGDDGIGKCLGDGLEAKGRPGVAESNALPVHRTYRYAPLARILARQLRNIRRYLTPCDQFTLQQGTTDSYRFLFVNVLRTAQLSPTCNL